MVIHSLKLSPYCSFTLYFSAVTFSMKPFQQLKITQRHIVHFHYFKAKHYWRRFSEIYLKSPFNKSTCYAEQLYPVFYGHYKCIDISSDHPICFFFLNAWSSTCGQIKRSSFLRNICKLCYLIALLSHHAIKHNVRQQSQCKNTLFLSITAFRNDTL